MAQRINENERLYSLDEYFSILEKSPEKLEYRQGRIYQMSGLPYRDRIYQMSGGSPEHGLIIGNTIIALGIALRGKFCKVFSSEVLIKTHQQNQYSFADVSVLCGRPEYEQIKNNRM